MQMALAFASIYIIWGSTYLAIRFSIETIPPFLMAAARFLIGGALFYAWARLRGARRPSLVNWKSAGAVGLLLLFGGNGGVVWAEQTVPSGLVAVLVATVPLWIVLIESLRGERPTKGVLAGIAIGFGGMILLVGQAGFSAAGSNIIGELIVIGATLSWATGSLYSRKAKLPASSQLSTSMQMLVAGVVFIVASFATNEWSGFNPFNVSVSSALSVVYLTVFGSLIALTAYLWLLRTTTPARVSTYAYINPVVAVVLGWEFDSETVSPATILSAAIIISSVVIINTFRTAKTARKASVPTQLVKGQFRLSRSGKLRFHEPRARRYFDWLILQLDGRPSVHQGGLVVS